MAGRASFPSCHARWSACAPIGPKEIGSSVKVQPLSFFTRAANGQAIVGLGTTSQWSADESAFREPQAFNKHGRGPRIHDLRHTFAVRTIMDWYRRGLDPDREMFKLSTYLGHSAPDATYRYIEAIPELLQLASECAERNLGRREAR